MNAKGRAIHLRTGLQPFMQNVIRLTLLGDGASLLGGSAMKTRTTLSVDVKINLASCLLALAWLIEVFR